MHVVMLSCTEGAGTPTPVMTEFKTMDSLPPSRSGIMFVFYVAFPLVISVAANHY